MQIRILIQEEQIDIHVDIRFQDYSKRGVERKLSLSNLNTKNKNMKRKNKEKNLYLKQ